LQKACDAAAECEREVNKLQKRLAEFRDREGDMSDDNFPASMVPPHAGWKLIANKTMRFGDVDVRRGSEITAEMLSKALNAVTLLSGGHIRWMPPQAAKPEPVAPKPKVDAPYVPVDHIRVLYDAMGVIAAQRNIDIHDCEDLADRTLWDRATTQFINEPQSVMSQAWGGGNRPTQSGDGSSRRIFDIGAFRKRLYSYGKQEVAA
jgi:hypothetical protein